MVSESEITTIEGEIDSSLIFLRGLMIGIILSLIFAAIFVTLLTSSDPQSTFPESLAAPLIVSAATIIAALTAVYSVNKNIKHQKLLHKNIKDRKRHAARTSLPLALAEIEEICISTLRQLVDTSEIINDSSTILSESSYQTFKQYIEHSEETEVGKYFCDFLIYYQVVLSRFSDYQIEREMSPELNHLMHEKTTDTIIYWEAFRSISETLLDHARNPSKGFDHGKVRKIFEDRFLLYRGAGRYADITDSHFNIIFSRVMFGNSFKFLKPSYFSV